MLLIENQSDLTDLSIKAEVSSDFSSRVHHLNSLVQYLIFQDPKSAWPILKNIEDMMAQNEYRPTAEFFYKKAVYFNSSGNFEQAEQLFESIVKKDTFNPNELLNAHILADFVACLLNRRKYVKADRILQLLKRQSLFKTDFLLQSKVLVREAHKYTLTKDKPKAVLTYLEASKLLARKPRYKYIDVEFLRFQLEVGLGTIYELKLEPTISLEHYLNALDLVEKMKFHFRKSWIYYKVGHTYLLLGENEKATLFHEKLLNLERYKDPIPAAGSLSDLGYISTVNGNFEEAKAYFDQAFDLHASYKLAPSDQIILLNRWVGALYSQQNDGENAIKFLSKAVDLAKNNNDLRMHALLLKDIATFYRGIGEHEKAYDYLTVHLKVHERYLTQLRSEQRLDLEVQYDAEISKQETKILRLESNKLQLKALRSQMNPHFIYNSLNAIQLFVLTGKSEDAALHLTSFSKLIRLSLEFSDKDFILFDQEISFLTEYLDLNLKLRFQEKFTFSIHVPKNVESEQFRIPSMILQPYIENAIEHGIKPLRDRKGKIDIAFKLQDNDTIVCTIRDNGVGINQAIKDNYSTKRMNKHRSMGTKITKKRLEFLSTTYNLPCNVRVKDLKDVSNEIGTVVQITLPIKWDLSI